MIFYPLHPFLMLRCRYLLLTSWAKRFFWTEMGIVMLTWVPFPYQRVLVIRLPSPSPSNLLPFCFSLSLRAAAPVQLFLPSLSLSLQVFQPRSPLWLTRHYCLFHHHSTQVSLPPGTDVSSPLLSFWVILFLAWHPSPPLSTSSSASCQRLLSTPVLLVSTSQLFISSAMRLLSCHFTSHLMLPEPGR